MVGTTSMDRFAISDLFVSDTDPNAGPVDPLAALEKTTAAQNHMNKVQVPRLEELQSLADHYGSDPYSLSRKARKRFREEKKIDKEKQAEDDELKGRYGLPETLALSAESEETRSQAREDWLQARNEMKLLDVAKRRKLEPVGIVPRTFPKSISSKHRSSQSSAASSSTAVDLLRARILLNTARRKPPDARRLARQ